MHSIITFSDRCTLKKVEVTSPDIFVINRSKVTNVVSAIWGRNPDALTAEQIQSIYDRLYPYSQVDAAAKEQHIADIEQTMRHETATPAVPVAPVPEEQIPVVLSKSAEIPLRCPRCGSALVLRTAKKGTNAGNQFYGCSNFPKCRYIQTP